jgi:hypothetical protein
MKPLHWDEINPATGTPYTYDHPNVRWGFVLEEGDEGFVPWVPVISPEPKPKKRKPMKRQQYYPSATGRQVLWLNNYVTKLAGHAATVGVSPAECAASIADARWVIYVIGVWLPAVRAWTKSCTEAAARAQSPDGSTLMLLPAFVPPPLPAAEVGGLPAVVPVEEGALDRIFALVQTIKEAPGYTNDIGLDLGIVGAAMTPPDLDSIAPVLVLELLAGGVRILWGWGGLGEWLDMCEIQVKRSAEAGWETLVFDPDPNFTDNTPFPATPQKVSYRAIFRAGESRVGLWSAEVSVNVG